MMHQRAGFSLVELLVVLGALAVISAIVLPAIVGARQRQPQVSCLVNLKQIQHAISLYTADYDGAYPPVVTSHFNAEEITTDTWNTLILPYYGSHQMERCPNIDSAIGAMKTTQPQLIFGYALNQKLNEDFTRNGNAYTQGIREFIVRFPAITVSVAESRLGVMGMRLPDSVQENGGRLGIYGVRYLETILQQQPASTRHNGGANYAFVDGHVKWLQPTSVNYNKQGDGVQPGFGL